MVEIIKITSDQWEVRCWLKSARAGTIAGTGLKFFIKSSESESFCTFVFNNFFFRDLNPPGISLPRLQTHEIGDYSDQKHRRMHGQIVSGERALVPTHAIDHGY